MCTAVVGRSGKGAIQPVKGASEPWIDQELAGCRFQDVRLDKRFRTLLEQVSNGVGESIPLVCQDWANTKAAYRFLSNEHVSEGAILAGHFQSTRDRFLAEPGPVLILHDTTEFSFKREDIGSIGMLNKGVAGQDNQGRLRHYTSCGLLMHASLAVTTEGLPLSLGGHEVLDSQEVQRHQRPQAQDQSNPRAH